MDGGDYAGYKQIVHNVQTNVITSTMSSTTCPYADGWYMLKVISSKAAIAQIVDTWMTGSSLFTSGSSWNTGDEIHCGEITKVKISTDSTGHKVLAYRRILL